MTEDELVALTRDLVTIPSHEDAGEREAGDLVERWLRAETDGEVRRDDHGNVFARRTDGEGPTLALVGHHDVVPPSDAQVASEGDRLTFESDGERLHGRGTADMKGALAAAMLAFRDAAPATDLVLASFVAEEQGGLGAQAAVEDGFAPDHAVVCEGSTGYSAPGVTDVAVAHRGRRAVTATARGEAGEETSEPNTGPNAVYRACDAVAELRAVDPPETTVLGRPMAGLLTVTGVEGGEAWNVVPERCAVTVDERTVPGARADLGRVEAIEGVSTTVDQDLPPMACSDPDLAAAALDATRATQDGAGEEVIKPHATDAGRLAAVGTACVVVGPSEPGEAHTADESVSTDVLARCRRIYEAVAERERSG